MPVSKLALVILLALPWPTFGQAKPQTQAAPAGGAEQQLIKLENDWNDFVVKRNAAGLERILADDLTSIDFEGSLLTKAQEIANLKSGDLAITSAVADELKVRVYGNTAVVTGRNTSKGKFKGKEISGQYRFTDTWDLRGGRWQCVATQGTKVVQNK